MESITIESPINGASVSCPFTATGTTDGCTANHATMSNGGELGYGGSPVPGEMTSTTFGFQFSDVPTGNYTLTVTAGTGAQNSISVTVS